MNSNFFNPLPYLKIKKIWSWSPRPNQALQNVGPERVKLQLFTTLKSSKLNVYSQGILKLSQWMSNWVLEIIMNLKIKEEKMFSQYYDCPTINSREIWKVLVSRIHIESIITFSAINWPQKDFLISYNLNPSQRKGKIVP